MNGKNSSDPNAVGHSNPFTAVVTALSDMISQKGVLSPAGEDERLDGKTVFITGANTGLGKAVAIDMAKRGARLLMACRSGHPDAGEDVKRLSGSKSVEMLKVDLSDLTSTRALCDQLKERGERLDRVIFNAGLMPSETRLGPQGFELMFAVHFLSTRLMIERMLADGVVEPNAVRRPRIIFVSSEAHRSSKPLDLSALGAPVEYGLKDGMGEYGRTKLLLTTLFCELTRRLADQEISIFALCPGPVASDIAREAPGWAKPILGPIMGLLFRSTEKAAIPVSLLAAGNAMEGRSGVYLHIMREKAISPLASNEEMGPELWQASAPLIAPYLA